MHRQVRFGFLLGLLVGTASVGAVSVMMGQAEARAQRLNGPRFNRYEVTQSSDGLHAYLWGVDTAQGRLHFIDRASVTDQAPPRDGDVFPDRDRDPSPIPPRPDSRRPDRPNDGG